MSKMTDDVAAMWTLIERLVGSVYFERRKEVAAGFRVVRRAADRVIVAPDCMGWAQEAVLRHESSYWAAKKILAGYPRVRDWVAGETVKIVV